MQKTLITALALAVIAGTAAAGEARIVDTEISRYQERSLMIRGEISIHDISHRWLAVFFQVRLDDGPLRVGGKDLLKKWGDLFTPRAGEGPAVWSDLRLELPLEEIEKAENLPRGKRTVLWVVCDVWDASAEKWVGAGWDAREPLIVDVDADGKITGYELFNTVPQDTDPVNPWKSKPGRVSRLALEHLKLKAGILTARTVGEKHETYDWLHRTGTVEGEDGESQLSHLEELNRGAFFEPITTAEQALELVALGHRDAMVIPSRNDFDIVLAYLRDKDFTAAILNDRPPGFGFEAVEVPGVGWRVRGLLFETRGLNLKPTGRVSWVDHAVTREGRLGRETIACIDTGTDVLLAVQGAKLWPWLPTVVTVTDEVTEIPEFVQELGGYLDPADWPPPEDR